MKIILVNLDVQFKGSLTAVTEVIGHDMICGAGLCSMQGTVVQRGVTGSGHAVLCVHFVASIYILLHSYVTGGTESSVLQKGLF
jgi:hypothetical protein